MARPQSSAPPPDKTVHNMSRSTITSHGEVTLQPEVLHHLGVKASDEIEIDLLPDGRGVIKAAKPAGSLNAFFGLLAGRSDKTATLEEINEAAAQGWAGRSLGLPWTPTSSSSAPRSHQI